MWAVGGQFANVDGAIWGSVFDMFSAATGQVCKGYNQARCSISLPYVQIVTIPGLTLRRGYNGLSLSVGGN